MLLDRCAEIDPLCQGYHRALTTRFRPGRFMRCEGRRAAILPRRDRAWIARATDPSTARVPNGDEYNDTWSDIAFIALCRKAYGNIAGWQSSRGWTDGKETYAGMVEVSRALMKA
jgi:hypothetical protein